LWQIGPFLKLIFIIISYFIIVLLNYFIKEIIFFNSNVDEDRTYKTVYDMMMVMMMI